MWELLMRHECGPVTIRNEKHWKMGGLHSLCLSRSIRKVKLKRLIGRARSTQVKEGLLAVLHAVTLWEVMLSR
jgi:hypothetical protein